MTTSAHSLRASSIGRLLAMPPSTSSRPSISTGAIAPGTDMLARIACAMLPRSSTTASPVSMSAATRGTGSGSFWKSVMSHAGVGQDAEEASIDDAGEHALRQREPAVLHAELGREQRLVVVGLAPDGDLLARRPVAEDLVPVGLEDDAPPALAGDAARGEGAADDRAHAGAGDAVHRHAQLLQHLEHADVRDAARAAARQREADARGRGGWLGDRSRVGRLCKHGRRQGRHEYVRDKMPARFPGSIRVHAVPLLGIATGTKPIAGLPAIDCYARPPRQSIARWCSREGRLMTGQARQAIMRAEEGADYL